MSIEIKALLRCNAYWPEQISENQDNKNNKKIQAFFKSLSTNVP